MPALADMQKTYLTQSTELWNQTLQNSGDAAPRSTSMSDANSAILTCNESRNAIRRSSPRPKRYCAKATNSANTGVVVTLGANQAFRLAGADRAALGHGIGGPIVMRLVAAVFQRALEGDGVVVVIVVLIAVEQNDMH